MGLKQDYSRIPQYQTVNDLKMEYRAKPQNMSGTCQRLSATMVKNKVKKRIGFVRGRYQGNPHRVVDKYAKKKVENIVRKDNNC